MTDIGTEIPGEIDATEGGERDYMAEALAQGWTDKDDFKGPPEKWVDAETFVKRQDDNLGLLKKRAEYLERQLKAQERAAKQAAEFFSKAEERAYERALADIRQQQEQAVQDGDVEAFRRLSKEADKLADDAKAKADKDYGEQEAMAALAEFRRQNIWFDRSQTVRGTDEDLEARAYFEHLVAVNYEKTLKGPDQMPPDEFYQMIGNQVAERFPALNAKPKTVTSKPASDVAAPTGGRAPSGSRSWAALPADAKQMADQFYKLGHIKAASLEEARAIYVKNYDWS